MTASPQRRRERREELSATSAPLRLILYDRFSFHL